MMIFLLVFSLLSFAGPTKKSGLPSYTPSNPNGYWAPLPKGRDYIFCGDRILFSKNFQASVKIEYAKGPKTASIKQHCQYRKNAIHKEQKTPGLFAASYERLNEFLSKIPKNKKHKSYIEKRGYSYKEIRRKQKLKDLNELRVANLLIPYLSKEEFKAAYQGTSNNPQYLDAEYSRYSSNLLTQHPSMLYTVDGKLFYFSFNMSKEQLALLNKAVSGGGGSGGGFSAGGGGGASSNSPKGRKPASQLGEGAPADGSDAFLGFNTNSNALQVAPKGTRLPEAFGVSENITFNVPSLNQIKTGISNTSSRNISSTKRKTSSRSSKRKSYRSSSLPYVRNVASVDNSSREYSKSSYSKSSSSSSSYDKEIPTNERYEKNISKATKANTKESEVGPAEILLTTVKSGDPDYTFYDPTDNSTCKSNQWSLALYKSQKIYKDINEAKKIRKEQPELYNQIKERILSDDFNKCIPVDMGSSFQKYCGSNSQANKDYQKHCLEREIKSKENDTCHNQVKTDIQNICSKYLGDNYLNVEIDKLMECSQIMMALSCKKIPCDIKETIEENTSTDSTDKNSNKKKKISLSVSLYEGAENGSQSLSKGLYIKSPKELKTLAHVKHESQWLNFKSTNNKIDLNTHLPETWPKELSKKLQRLNFFKEDILLLSIFYHQYDKDPDMCPDPNKSTKAPLKAVKVKTKANH